MKTLLFSLPLMVLLTQSQGKLNDSTKPIIKPSPELIRLRDEFVQATNEYKISLNKLLQIYETNVVKADERLEISRRSLAEGLIARTQVEENERQVVIAKERVQRTKEELAKADQQIAEAMDDSKLQTEYKSAVQQRRKTRKGRCTSWTLRANQQTTANSVSFSYKFVCQN